MASLTGQSIGRYHILEQLGEGGMATVYKAFDTRLEAEVALKVIRTDALPQNAIGRALQRFEREAKALARLTHPNIVPIHDYGEQDGKPYLVMPYLPGGTLKRTLTGKPMPWRDAARLVLPVANALDYAHRQGLIHRDVKPSNILITADGEPMLTDFGVAKVLTMEETQDLTGTSVGLGTPEYMAPEQATSRVADRRADIYALGVVFYELVTGRKPFVADTPMAVIVKHSSEPLPRPRSIVPGLPESVERILLKALAKRPEDRYQSMAELAQALRAAEGAGVRTLAAGPVSAPATKRETAAPKSEPAARPRAAGRSLPVWIAIAAGVLVLGAAAFFGSRLLSASATPAAEPTSTGVPPTAALTIPDAVPATATALPTAMPTGLPVEITPAQGVAMWLVPAGEFTMGCDQSSCPLPTYDTGPSVEDYFRIQKPVHQVYLDAYFIDKYEVTNALYKACVEAGVCSPPGTRNATYAADSSDYPVTDVAWSMASTYCQWRGAQLPTEAQWEKAARGTDGRSYPWGEGVDCSRANYGVCVGHTTEVGSYESGKSPYGLYDMAGNASEWVADWYSETFYRVSPTSNPLGPVSGSYRVIRGGRGGNWGASGEDFIRATIRYPGNSLNLVGVGFRCAMDAADAGAGIATPSPESPASGVSATSPFSEATNISYGEQVTTSLSSSPGYTPRVIYKFSGSQGDKIAVKVSNVCRWTNGMCAKVTPGVHLALQSQIGELLIEGEWNAAVVDYELPYSGIYYIVAEYKSFDQAALTLEKR